MKFEIGPVSFTKPSGAPQRKILVRFNTSSDSIAIVVSSSDVFSTRLSEELDRDREKRWLAPLVYV